MSTGARRAATVAVAVVVVVSAGPALAETPDLPDVPPVLDGELSASETLVLSDLTAGSGVALEAFVRTPDGAEVLALDAATRSDATAAARLLEAQPSVTAAGLAVPTRIAGGALDQYGNTMIRSELARAEVDAPLSDVVVAVLDTGVAPHAELTAALLPGQNFTSSPGGATDATDRHGHGTHVAGTVAADAGSTVEGIAPGVRVLPVKVLSDGGGGSSVWANQGIVWAADNGADVINMSLGGPGASGVYAEAVAYARSKGVTVIAAAGNDATSEPFWPAAEAGVVAVAAVDQNREQAWFSNFGSYVDLAAPGVGIVSTDRSGGTSVKNGTSMAAPHVAGVAALVAAAAPGLTPDQVEQALAAGATDLGAPGRDDVFGRGLVDAVRAVRTAKAIAETGSVPGNQPPVAGDDAITLTAADPAGQVQVTANDSDPDGDEPSVVAAGGAAHGTVRVVSEQVVEWTPAAHSPGGVSDAFTYTVSDGRGGTATGTVTVTVEAAQVPGDLSIAAVTPGNGTARVRWTATSTDGGSPVTGYRVYTYRNGALVRSTDVAAPAASAVVADLTNGTAYRFGVRARNAVGLGPQSPLTAAVTPRTTPGAPKLGKVSAARAAAVVRWAAPASTGGAAISGYVVRTYSGRTLVRSTTVSATARSLTVGALSSGRAYTFKVQARNAAGLGTYSAASPAIRPTR